MACPDETTLVAFLDGRLTAPALAEVEAHLDVCAACREVVAAVAPAVLTETSALAGGLRPLAGRVPAPAPAPAAAALVRGATVGRYVILGLVGRGGMGEVYAAYDPELDRRIALKLLHDSGLGTEPRARSRIRLLKEAKAIARLSHPSVVTVHDAGTADDRVFIAMEFVEGQTLAASLGGKPRPWSEIRAVFLAAGRGLAAAHAAGIIHRDFKPQNVMVTAEGVVRVMDFGVASEAAPDDRGAPAGASERPELPLAPVGALTGTGTLVGTPAYMAPEQFLAQRADARTDQFSFCVSLYEALHGERPFAGDSLAALAESVTNDRVREPSQRGRTPAWLRKIVLRGLRTKREDRYPSMEALLAALARDPGRQRRRIVVGLALGGLMFAGGALGQRTLGRSGAALCEGAPDKLEPIWESAGSTHHPRRDAIRAAFFATGGNRAGATWTRTAAILDGFARNWEAMYGEACRATHVRGEQSEEVLDLRMDCLNRNRESLRALTDVFAVADPTVVRQAVEAAAGLPDLGDCADVAVLKAVLPPPRDPGARKQVDDIRCGIAEARVQAAAGHWSEAAARSTQLTEAARRLGYQPLIAETLSLSGWLHAMFENAKVSAEEYEQALWSAEATRHDEVAAESAVMLVGVVGHFLGHLDDAERWGHFADAILARMGPGHERLQGWLAHNRGESQLQAGEFEAAAESFRKAIVLKQRAEGDDSPDVANSVNSLSTAYSGRHDYAAALEQADRARAIDDRAFGPGGPLSAREISNRCEDLNGLGRYAEALDACREALEVFEAALGKDHPWPAYPLTASGVALLGLGRPAEALPVLQRALDIRERLDPNPQVLGETRFALARALWDSRTHRARARAAAIAARADYAKLRNASYEIPAIDAWLAAHLVDEPAPGDDLARDRDLAQLHHARR